MLAAKHFGPLALSKREVCNDDRFDSNKTNNVPVGSNPQTWMAGDSWPGNSSMGLAVPVYTVPSDLVLKGLLWDHKWLCSLHVSLDTCKNANLCIKLPVAFPHCVLWEKAPRVRRMVNRTCEVHAYIKTVLWHAIHSVPGLKTVYANSFSRSCTQ